MNVVIWVLFKQWPLAGEFVEFEYSPKWPFPPFWPDSIHSPAIRQLLSPDSIHSTDIRQPLSPDSIHSTDIRQPFSPDSTHSTLDTFAGIRQTVTRIRHIRTSNSPFRRIWGEWPLLSLYSMFRRLWLIPHKEHQRLLTRSQECTSNSQTKTCSEM